MHSFGLFGAGAARSRRGPLLLSPRSSITSIAMSQSVLIGSADNAVTLGQVRTALDQLDTLERVYYERSSRTSRSRKGSTAGPTSASVKDVASSPQAAQAYTVQPSPYESEKRRKRSDSGVGIEATKEDRQPSQLEEEKATPATKPLTINTPGWTWWSNTSARTFPACNKGSTASKRPSAQAALGREHDAEARWRTDTLRRVDGDFETRHMLLSRRQDKFTMQPHLQRVVDFLQAGGIMLASPRAPALRSQASQSGEGATQAQAQGATRPSQPIPTRGSSFPSLKNQWEQFTSCRGRFTTPSDPRRGRGKRRHFSRRSQLARPASGLAEAAKNEDGQT